MTINTTFDNKEIKKSIMKTKIFNLFLLSTIFSAMLFIIGCTKNTDTPCHTTFIYQNILPSERPAFIYKGYEKLTFIRHPQLDTLILNASWLDSTYSPTKGDQSDCPTFIEGQVFETIFTGTINTVKYTIRTNIWKNNPDLDPSRMAFLFSIDFVNGAGSSEGFLRQSVDFLNSNLLETDTINSKIYRDVIKTSLTSPSMNNIFMLYSQEYGIIKIENYKNGEYLELLKKE